MEMTINEAIIYYEVKNVVLTEEEALANTIAINVMRKYQKIEQILDDYDLEAWEVLERIRKVVEDGTN